MSETARGRAEPAKLSPPAQAAARRVAESKATVPHLYLEAEIEMTVASELLERVRTDGGTGPAVLDLVIEASGLALRERPRVNASYRDGALELHSRVNVGFTVSTDDAAVVPVVHDADSLSLAEIAERTRALAAKAVEDTLTSPEVAGATFTVSDLGSAGVSSFQAVVTPPQVAVLAIGEVAAKPVVSEDGSVGGAPVMRATLSCDHRALGGAEAAAFLTRVRELLEGSR